ncbi:hypothetical protein [Pseudomonas syringae group genomosp. 7]|nr:hypothetical protein [Pseudomonas syringae group genomosp. 7]
MIDALKMSGLIVGAKTLIKTSGQISGFALTHFACHERVGAFGRAIKT